MKNEQAVHSEYIRAASIEDAEAITDLLLEVGWFEPLNNLSREGAVLRVNTLLTACIESSKHSVYVHRTNDNTLTGYAAVHWSPFIALGGIEGNVSELFISPTVRGQGIGSQLLSVILEEARRRGCFRLSLLNFRNRESYKRGFYRKQGWIERPDAASFIYKIT